MVTRAEGYKSSSEIFSQKILQVDWLYLNLFGKLQVIIPSDLSHISVTTC